AEDTKSSAGDKYETGREMLKQEINKYNQQLAQARQMRQLFAQIDPKKELDEIGLGSLVQTNEGWYYFAASLGKIEGLQPPCFALSLVSPIGKALLDQKAGAQVSFMQRRITILTIQ
ncbi:MAG: 3-oxoacyl-ACP synthase, partial [Bacteroidota bacterium]